MKVQQTKIDGLYIIKPEPFQDGRGFFNRIFCMKELEEIRQNITITQANHSMTCEKGTVRGLHFQNKPFQEMKIVRCVAGSVFDVGVDIRKGSPTFLKWHGEILSAENMNALVVPEGFAHGFQTLTDNAELIYLSTAPYHKDAESGIRYDDPMLKITWPLPVTIVSEKDAGHNLLTKEFTGI
jgi:dTDP-4-dehydrorhamnose 3,5-epimerase